MYSVVIMTIKLAFTTEKDLEKKPATYLMLGSFTDAAASYGLGAKRRTFHFAAQLLRALEPAQFNSIFLHDLETELEQGRDLAIDISDDLAAAIGMLPDRDGFEWVYVTIRKVPLGDGLFRYTASYRSGAREVEGSGLETLDMLETRVREFVALDWTTINERLQTTEEWSGVFNLPIETARFIFEGEK
jgi:hypothetical protein